MARTALASAPPAAIMISALVNGAAGVVVMTHERPFVVMGFTVVRGKIVEIDCFLDPERLARLDLAGLDGGPESLIESRRATRSAAAALGVRMHSGQKMTNPNQPIAAAQMLIRRPVRVVFEAFVDPALTSRFWFSRGSGRLEAGKSVRWDWEMYGVGTTVDVKAIEPDKRILVEWDGPEDPSPVEWTFEAKGEGADVREDSKLGVQRRRGRGCRQGAGLDWRLLSRSRRREVLSGTGHRAKPGR